MSIRLYISALIICFSLIFGCSESNKKKVNKVTTGNSDMNDSIKPTTLKTNIAEPKKTNKDSIKLTKLIRDAYKWHNTKYLPSVPFKTSKETENILIGVDWETYNKNIELLENSNLFTNEFLKKHKSIAFNIDESMKTADVKWRYNEITIWDTEVDDWCNCQDHPDNYWETLIIDNLTIQDNTAKFNLKWKFYNNDYSSMNYRVTAKKIKSEWKIDYLEGYDNYKTTEEYNQIMSN